GAPGRTVSDHAGLGVGDLEQHRGRQLDVQHPAVVGGDDRVLVLEEEVLRVPDDLGSDLDLVERARVHEDVRRAVVVEVLHGPLVDVGDVDLTSELKVRSTVFPDSTFFSLDRTTAPPLPGLWCWNQMTC